MTALETIQYRPPCAFRWSPSCPIHPPSLPHVFGWLLCLFIDWGPPKTTTNFVFLIFCPLIRQLKRCDSVHPHLQCPAILFTRLYSVGCADSRLVVVSPHPLEAIENQGPVALSFFIFSFALFNPRKRRVNILPHTFRPVASPLQLPPPPPTPLLGWLLVVLIE